jgi:hypothetical protein
MAACTAAISVFADGACCVKCGCQEDVRCVCRPIYTTKYIEITCWDSVCEDICLPPRSRCEQGYANSNDPKSPPANNENWTAGTCKGIKIRSSNKLVRKTYLQPIPTVVWVVEYVCCHCRRGNDADVSSPVAVSAKSQSDSYDLRQSGRESLSAKREDLSSHL